LSSFATAALSPMRTLCRQRSQKRQEPTSRVRIEKPSRLDVGIRCRPSSFEHRNRMQEKEK
jgi:hypothetical protein